MGAEIKLHLDVDNPPLSQSHPSAKAEAERLLQDIDDFNIATSSVDPVYANIRVQRLLSRCETFLQSYDHTDQVCTSLFLGLIPSFIVFWGLVSGTAYELPSFAWVFYLFRRVAIAATIAE